MIKNKRLICKLIYYIIYNMPKGKGTYDKPGRPATKKPAPKAKPKVKAKDFDYKLVRGYVPKSVPKKKK